MKAGYRAIAVVVVALAVAGCAASGSGHGDAPATTAAEDLKAAQAAFTRGDKDEYLRLLTRAIDAGTLPDVSQSAAFYVRGGVYLEKGQNERAIADCSAAIQLRPGYPEAYVNRAVAYARSGQYDPAIADLDAAIRLKPDFALAYYNRGGDYARKDKHDQAIADYDKAIQLRPDFAEAHLDRGLSYHALEKFDRAIADDDEAIRLKPDFSVAYLNRGFANAAKGRDELAMPDFDTAIRLAPKVGVAYQDRGLIQLALGHYDYAAADFGRALELEPFRGSLVLWLHLARLEAGADDHDEFARNLAKIDRNKWPEPIAELYLERITPEQLLAASRFGAPATARENECFASFNIGEYHRFRKQDAAAKSVLHHVAEACANIEILRQLAASELRQLGD